MKRTYALLIATVMMMVAGPAVFAQPCVPSYPDVLHVGESACIQMCVGSYITIELEGTVPGPEALPILIWETGCQAGVTLCAVQCTPIDPPDGLIPGGDPFYPDDWYGENDCFIIYLRWGHDGIWWLEILTFCEGCFCLTYDYQLAAQLTSFTAMPGDGEITLNWVTASESDNDRFDLLRDEVKIAEVDANNNVSGGTYTYTDGELMNGRTYAYTLVAVDVNGHRDALQTINAVPSSSADIVVTAYSLHQNYPNPFNPETSIAFDLVEDGMTTLAIYNVLGERVATLVDGEMTAGRHTVVFNGSHLTSGVYVYKLEVNGFTNTKKLVLLK